MVEAQTLTKEAAQEVKTATIEKCMEKKEAAAKMIATPCKNSSLVDTDTGTDYYQQAKKAAEDIDAKLSAVDK